MLEKVQLVVSIQNGYYRPNIVESEKSFIDGTCVRHPIVESIFTY